MAPRKTTARKKRSTRSKSAGRSPAAMLTVGAIVVLGAAALWATSQSKSPSSSVTALFRNATGMGTGSNTAPERRTAQAPSRQQNIAQNNTQSRPQVQVQSQTQSQTAAPAPLRRPPLNVGQSQAAEPKNQQKQVAMVTPQIAPKPAQQPQVQAANKPAATQSMPPLPPVSKAVTDDNSRHASGAFKIPKAIIARQALTIRETAWDKAKIVGSVEKGREMRSYAKVGRWHRVVVPSTNIIGWVQEDQLMFKNRQDRIMPVRAAQAKSTSLTTGSVNKQPAAQSASGQQTEKPRNSGLVAPVYPQQPVVKK